MLINDIKKNPCLCLGVFKALWLPAHPIKQQRPKLPSRGYNRSLEVNTFNAFKNISQFSLYFFHDILISVSFGKLFHLYDRIFQKTTNLPVSGKLDSVTLAMMDRRRCGVEDSFNDRSLKYRVLGR